MREIRGQCAGHWVHVRSRSREVRELRCPSMSRAYPNLRYTPSTYSALRWGAGKVRAGMHMQSKNIDGGV